MTVAGLAGALGFALLRLGRGFRGLPGAPATRREPPETSLEGSLKPPVVGS